MQFMIKEEINKEGKVIAKKKCFKILTKLVFYCFAKIKWHNIFAHATDKTLLAFYQMKL